MSEEPIAEQIAPLAVANDPESQDYKVYSFLCARVGPATAKRLHTHGMAEKTARLAIANVPESHC